MFDCRTCLYRVILWSVNSIRVVVIWSLPYYSCSRSLCFQCASGRPLPLCGGMFQCCASPAVYAPCWGRGVVSVVVGRFLVLCMFYLPYRAARRLCRLWRSHQRHCSCACAHTSATPCPLPVTCTALLIHSCSAGMHAFRCVFSPPVSLHCPTRGGPHQQLSLRLPACTAFTCDTCLKCVENLPLWVPACLARPQEVALIHSEGILAGEMKHGPLALVDENLPIVVVATRDSMYKKMESIIQQLLARSARLFIVCNEGDEAMKAYEAKGCKLIQVCSGWVGSGSAAWLMVAGAGRGS